jgi:hypothetical protein
MADREVNVRVNLVPGAAGGMEAAARQQGETLARAQQSALARGVGVAGGAAGALNVAAAAAGGGGLGGILGAAASVAGPVGLVAAAGLGLVSAVNAIAGALKGYVPTLQEIHQRFQRANEDLNRTRATGQTDAELLRRALSAQQVAQLEAAQATGNYARQQQILAEAGAQAQARLPGLEARNLGELRTELEGLVRRGREIATGQAVGPPAELSAEMSRIQTRVGQIFGQAGQQLPQNLTTNLTQTFAGRLRDLQAEQITQLGQSLTTPLVQARGLVAISRAAAGPLGVPSLRPGAPEFPEGAFRGGRGDILDLHAALQAEAARDPREEARFQALYRLLEEWRAEMRRIGSPLGGVPGAVGP